MPQTRVLRREANARPAWGGGRPLLAMWAVGFVCAIYWWACRYSASKASRVFLMSWAAMSWVLAAPMIARRPGLVREFGESGSAIGLVTGGAEVAVEAGALRFRVRPAPLFWVSQ